MQGSFDKRRRQIAHSPETMAPARTLLAPRFNMLQMSMSMTTMITTMMMSIITTQLTTTTLIVMKLYLGLALLSRLSCELNHVLTMLGMTAMTVIIYVMFYYSVVLVETFDQGSMLMTTMITTMAVIIYIMCWYCVLLFETCGHTSWVIIALARRRGLQ